nr:immunoglobulin light chain junction region [Macaca mulatta]
CLQYRYLPPTI